MERLTSIALFLKVKLVSDHDPLSSRSESCPTKGFGKLQDNQTGNNESLEHCISKPVLA
jgi:hypothetical protein